MTTYAPPSREDRLKRLKEMQEGLSKIKVGGEGGVLQLESGKTTIVRILPPIGRMDNRFYHQAVGYHMIGDTVARCSEFTTSYEIKCPICEVCEVLKRGGPKDKALYEQVRLSKKYWMNVIVRGDKDNFDTADGPYILKAGAQIFQRTRSLVADPDYGLIDDVENGTDLKIDKKGEGLKTEYQTNPRKGDYQPLVAGPDGKVDWEAVTKIMEAARDLSCVQMPDNPDDDKAFLEELGEDPVVKVYGYERTVNTFGVCLETIHELNEIILANKSKNDKGEEGEEGSHAKPIRGSSNGSAGNAGNITDDIKARIAALRANKG